MIAGGLHEFVDDFQKRLNYVGEAIYESFFAKRPLETMTSQRQTQFSSLTDWSLKRPVQTDSDQYTGLKPYSLESAMLFTIDHTTEYRFTRPVFFEPHQLRFQPRNDAAQRLVRFDLDDRSRAGRHDPVARRRRQPGDAGLVRQRARAA